MCMGFFFFKTTKKQRFLSELVWFLFFFANSDTFSSLCEWINWFPKYIIRWLSFIHKVARIQSNKTLYTNYFFQTQKRFRQTTVLYIESLFYISNARACIDKIVFVYDAIVVFFSTLSVGWSIFFYSNGIQLTAKTFFLFRFTLTEFELHIQRNTP